MQPRDNLAGNYSGYEIWKKWDKPFIFSRDEAEYYTGELTGLKLRNLHVLEIGFGSGSFLAWARSEGAIVAGVEIIQPMVDAAVSRGIELLPESFEQLSDQYSNRFSVIAAFDVFEHLSHPAIFAKLKAVSSMLTVGGILLLRYPNGQSPFGLGAQNGDLTHLTALSRPKIDQLAAGCGLSTLRYGGAYRILGSGRVKFFRLVRYALQDLSAVILNSIWGLDLVWAPVVTHVMRKI